MIMRLEKEDGHPIRSHQELIHRIEPEQGLTRQLQTAAQFRDEILDPGAGCDDRRACHLVAWIRQESSRIKHLWRLTDSEISSLFSGLAYPCNKVASSTKPTHPPYRGLSRITARSSA